MNRKRAYWLGFGSGLVIAAVLIQMMTSVSDAEPLDLQTLEAEAGKQGYRLVRENESVQIVTETIQYAIYILPDMSHEQIADLLTNIGYIADREAFLEQLDELPEGRRVKPGYYEITHSLSNDELLNMITEEDIRS